MWGHWAAGRADAIGPLKLLSLAVFLATGGGGDPYVARLATFNMLTELGPAEMIAVDDLDDDAFVATASMSAIW